MSDETKVTEEQNSNDSHNPWDQITKTQFSSPENLLTYANSSDGQTSSPPEFTGPRAYVESISSCQSSSHEGSVTSSNARNRVAPRRRRLMYSSDIGIDVLPPSNSSLSLAPTPDVSEQGMLVPEYAMPFSMEQDSSDQYNDTQFSAKARTHRYRPGAHDGWMQCAKALKEHDDIVVNAWKEGIDTLLVFAGLFSAVLTAFNIESYTLLQPPTTQPIVQLLSQISDQLENSTVLVTVDTSAARFRASASAVIINVLWFASLVFSLVAASLAILVKQWLQEYGASISSQPRERTRIRQYRFDGLVRWRVNRIIMLLPLLLQIALILFFAGLIVLLWSLHIVVAVIVTVLIAIWIAFWLFTVVMPAIYADCPYKSSEAWGFFGFLQSTRRLYVIAAAYFQRNWQYLVDSTADSMTLPQRMRRTMAKVIKQLAEQPYYSSWREREKVYVYESSSQLDQHTLVGADEALLDDSLLESIVRPCLYDLPLNDGVKCLFKLLMRRANCTIDNLKDWTPSSKDKGIPPLIYVAVDMLAKIDSESGRRQQQPRLTTILFIVNNYLRVNDAEVSDDLGTYILEVIPCFLDEYSHVDISHNAIAVLSNVFNKYKKMDSIALKQLLLYVHQVFELADWERQTVHFLRTSMLALQFITHSSSTGIEHSLLLTRMLSQVEAFLGALATDTLAGANIRSADFTTTAGRVFLIVRDFARVYPRELNKTWITTLFRFYEKVSADINGQRYPQSKYVNPSRTAMKELCRLYGLQNVELASGNEASDASFFGVSDSDSEPGIAPRVFESPLPTNSQTTISDERNARFGDS